MLIQITNYCLTGLQGARTVIDVEETRESYQLNPIAIPRLQVQKQQELGVDHFINVIAIRPVGRLPASPER